MLKRSFIASGALHVAIIAAASFAWPHAFELSEEPSDIIPVELMTVAETTNVAPKVVEQPREPPELKEIPMPVAAPIPPPPPPEEVEVAPEVEKKPPPPEPKQVVEAVKPPPTPPVPRQRPQPEPPQPQFSVDSVLALLESKAPQKAPPTPQPQPKAEIADAPQKGLGAQNASTLDLRDALLSQIRECWNVPVGAPTPEKLIVQVRVFLARDGSLAQPPLLEPQTRAAAASDPYMRTAAEAALRAVNVCEPYRRLPADRYDSWREIVMTFDPSRMVGRP
jgi:outer membrane biosynthesis protein TonB